MYLFIYIYLYIYATYIWGSRIWGFQFEVGFVFKASPLFPLRLMNFPLAPNTAMPA